MVSGGRANFHGLASRHRRLPFPILKALAALMLLAPFPLSAHGVGELGEPPLPLMSPTTIIDGSSGAKPTPLAAPGQRLPLKPMRKIRFDTNEATAPSLDLSPDGRTILFDMLGDIWLLDARGGQARAITRGMAYDSQPVFSPDGKRILFLSDRSGSENLWVMNANGSSPRQISLYDDDPIWVSPAWSADGNAAYVTRFWPDRNAYETWAFRLDASDATGAVLIPNWPGADRQGETLSSLGAMPSPDGRSLYYAAHSGAIGFDHPAEWQIARRELATGKTEILVRAVGDTRLGPVQSSVFNPVVSHDGRLLAYGERRTGKTWLHIRDLPSGDDRVLAELDHDELQSSHWSGIIPRFAFTPDDRGIVIGRTGHIQRIDIATGDAGTIPFQARVAMELGPLVRTRIEQERGPVRARIIQTPALSPNGAEVAFSALGHIYLMPLDGVGAPRRLDDGDDEPQFHPSWSPDGKSIAYITWSAKRGGAVWTKPIEGGPARRLTSRPAFFTHPVFTPDGKSIIVLRSSHRDRLNSYLEFGQFRDAELVVLDGAGAAEPRLIATGKMGGVPHFGPQSSPQSQHVYIDSPEGMRDIDYSGVPREAMLVQAIGPGWYFAQGPAPVDDMRISPDGKWVLAQIAQQLHLFAMPAKAGAVVNLSMPSVAHRRITDVGADFFGWAEGGKTVFWSVGSTLYRRALKEVAPDAGSSVSAGADTPQSITGGVSATEIPVLAPRDTPRGALLLRGGNAITMKGDEVIADADILIVDDHIGAIAPRGGFGVPEGTPVRELGGAYIIPGLIDVHDHIADIRRDVLDLHNWGPAASLAYGVTTTFDPSSLSIDMFAYQDLIDSGQMTGSRIVSTGPAIFSFNDFRSKDEIKAVLGRYRDHYRTRNLKMYRTGNRRVRQWFIEAAQELGMTPTTEGALSRKQDLTQIIDGYSGNEHSIPPMTLHEDVLKLFAQSGTSYALTLQITHGGAPAQDWFIAREAPHGDAKYARFSPPWFRDQKLWQREWRDPGEYMFAGVAASAARFQRMGGLLAVGAHGEVPGLGTHWEMEAYAMGGMKPMEVLKAATIDGAKAIGRDVEFGSIEPGKYADLVILDRNPLEDIRNSRSIREVMKNGRLYDGDTLSELWPREQSMEQFWFQGQDPVAAPPPIP